MEHRLEFKQSDFLQYTGTFLGAAINLRVYSHLHPPILQSVAFNFRHSHFPPIELNIIIFSPPFWTNMVHVALMSTVSLGVQIKWVSLTKKNVWTYSTQRLQAVCNKEVSIYMYCKATG